MQLSWLNQCSKFLKSEARFFLFYDSRQNIFGTDFTLPLGHTWERFPLNFNYRNTKQINKFINEHIGTSFQSGPVPEGEKVKRRAYRQDDLKNALFRSLSEVHRVAGVPLEQIKVITDGSAARWKLEDHSDAGSYTYEALDADKPQLADRLYYTSIHKFKGCEAEVLLLLKDRLEEVKDRNTLYTQLSRARSVLYVMEPEN